VISSPKDRREQKDYQNSGSFGEHRWGDFAGVDPNIGNPLEQQITLCEDLAHHATSLRAQAPVKGLGA
jgi:hypothetical protein